MSAKPSFWHPARTVAARAFSGGVDTEWARADELFDASCGKRGLLTPSSTCRSPRADAPRAQAFGRPGEPYADGRHRPRAASRAEASFLAVGSSPWSGPSRRSERCLSTLRPVRETAQRNAAPRLAPRLSVSVLRRRTNRRAPTLARRSSKCPRAASPSLDDAWTQLTPSAERDEVLCLPKSDQGHERDDAVARARRSQRSASRIG
jgi:hypothetical protein